MSDGSKFGKAVLLYSFIFCTAVIISAFIGKMIISDTVYSPISPDFSAVSLGNAVKILSKAVRSSSIQTALVFFASFSVFAMPAAAAVSLYRGVSLGYTAAALSKGALITSFGNAATVGDYAPILILYFLSGTAMIILSSIAVTHSAGGFTDIRKRRMLSRYLMAFFTFSGVIFTADALKLLFI